MNNNPTDDASTLNFDKEPATQPQPAAASESIEPTAPVKSKGKARKPLTVAIVAAVLIVLIGGGVGAYKLWYQNPERVVTSALVNALQSDSLNTSTVITSDSELSQGILSVKMKKFDLTANGSLTSGTGDTSAKLKLELNGREYTVGAKARLTDDKTIYFQIVDIEDLITKLGSDFSSGSFELSDKAKSQLEAIQNKWVKVTTDDMGEDAELFTCMVDTVKKVAKDPKSAEQAKQLYMDNKFLKVSDEVQSKDGNLGYRVSVDAKKLAQYDKASADSILVKEMKKCPGYEESPSAEDVADVDTTGYEKPKTETTVWVSRFGHELKRVDYKISSKQTSTNKKMEFEGQTKFSYEEVEVEEPDKATSLQDWQADVEKFIESIQEAFMNGMIEAAESAPVESEPVTSV